MNPMFEAHNNASDEKYSPQSWLEKTTGDIWHRLQNTASVSGQRLGGAWTEVSQHPNNLPADFVRGIEFDLNAIQNVAGPIGQHLLGGFVMTDPYAEADTTRGAVDTGEKVKE